MNDWTDAELEAAIRSLNEPTAEAVAAAKAIPIWSYLDRELELLIEGEQASAVRSSPTTASPVQSLRWHGHTSTGEPIELRVQVDVDSRSVSGVVVPASEIDLTVVGPEGLHVEAASDELGFFELAIGRSGPVRLIIGPPANAASPVFII